MDEKLKPCPFCGDTELSKKWWEEAVDHDR